VAVTPYQIPRFGGLDLRDQPDELGPQAALDLRDVDLDKPGAVRTRIGSELFATPASSTAVPRMRPFYRTAGDQLLAHFTTASAGKVTAFNAAGTAVATQTMASAASVCDMASSGTPGAQRAYVCDSGGPMFRWDGAAFTSIAGSPRCKYVTTTADFRLVAANVATLPTGSGAASASSSLVVISEKGDPETWPANNYIYFSPGDGDDITATLSWQNLTFIFKRFKFFVIYGTGVDQSGNPMFDYRTVEGRVAPQTPFSAVAAPEGVYFVSGDGVYLTTGFAPRKVSSALDPFFTGDVSPYWTGSTISVDNWGDGTDATNVWGGGTSPALRWGDGSSLDMRLAYANDQLYCFRKGRPDMFKLDTTTNQWTYWTFPLDNHSLTSMQLGAGGPEVLLLGQTTRIVKMDKSALTDSGTAMVPRYRSGFYSPLGQVAEECIISESILDGAGSPAVSIAKDFATDMPTSGGGARRVVKLGSALSAKQGRHRKSQRGRRFSYQLETPTASDDFSADSLSDYTVDQGLVSTLTVTGGGLRGAISLSNQSRLVLTDATFTDFGDVVVTVRATVGATLTNFLVGAIFKRVDASNALFARISDDGSASALSVAKNVAGVTSDVAVRALTRLVAGSSYWVRARIEGNVVTAEHFTADPASNSAAVSVGYTLSGPEASLFGQGVAGKAGIQFTPQSASASVDDFSVVGGAWRVESIVQNITGVRAEGLRTAA
jgi:hypothetical protein